MLLEQRPHRRRQERDGAVHDEPVRVVAPGIGWRGSGQQGQRHRSARQRASVRSCMVRLSLRCGRSESSRCRMNVAAPRARNRISRTVTRGRLPARASLARTESGTTRGSCESAAPRGPRPGAPSFLGIRADRAEAAVTRSGRCRSRSAGPASMMTSRENGDTGTGPTISARRGACGAPFATTSRRAITADASITSHVAGRDDERDRAGCGRAPAGHPHAGAEHQPEPGIDDEHRVAVEPPPVERRQDAHAVVVQEVEQQVGVDARYASASSHQPQRRPAWRARPAASAPRPSNDAGQRHRQQRLTDDAVRPAAPERDRGVEVANTSTSTSGRLAPIISAAPA